MKCLPVGMVMFVGIACAAHSQSDLLPPSREPVHPGTAILDSMGIFAGNPIPVDEQVNPGTAILNSMGIFAGTPIERPTGMPQRRAQ